MLEKGFSTKVLQIACQLFEKYDRHEIHQKVAQIVQAAQTEEEAIAMLKEKYPELKNA
jgi:hypothetical protein